MKDEFIIINKTTIQKRIEELGKEYILLSNKSDRSLSDIEDEREIIGEQRGLAMILSQSTPLIPEIEKAFESGVDSLQDNLIQKLGLTYQTNEVSSTTINSMRGDLEYYISNLKLDI